VKDLRDVVIPGDVLGDYPQQGRLPYGLFKEGDKIYSAIYGLIDKDKGIKVTPLNGKYLPRVGDIVIGIVIMSRHNSCLLDINSINYGNLHLGRPVGGRQIRLEPGDVVTAKITHVDEVGDVVLESPRKLVRGKVIEIKPTKVPRVFGKSGSMLELIKNYTGVSVVVGKNGRIWLNGDPDKIKKAEKALRFIERNAHKYGVTDAVKKMLEGDN
jgi:exosome complex component RRP4